MLSMARVKCPSPFCGSTNCTPITESKRYKAGKGAVGGVIGALALGPIGAAAGVAAGFNGKRKVKFMCNKCGKIFEVKV